MLKAIILCACLLSCATRTSAADWPQWLGPERSGAASESIAAWTEVTQPQPVWRLPVSQAFSSPVVAGDIVYLHAAVQGKEQEQVLALQAANGEQVWSDVYDRPAYKSVLGVGPRATPTLAQGRLFTLGINGVLSCYDAFNGQRHWQVDLYERFQADLPGFAVCCSPLVIGNRVIVSVGGPGRCAVALNTQTGETEWQSLDDAASTSSAILFAGGERPAGGAPDVVLMTPLRVLGLDALDGALRWEHAMVFQPQGTSPTPLVLGDRIVASTQAHGAVCVHVTSDGERQSAAEAWQNSAAKSYFSSGVATTEALYLITNSLEPLPTTSLTCLDPKNGKQLWTEGKIGYFHAAPILLADGKLLMLNDSGLLTLLDVNRTGVKELARAKVCGGTLVAPALSNGRLFVRDDKELICVQLAP
jgi:outer membrane protein assembly factor BamB